MCRPHPSETRKNPHGFRLTVRAGKSKIASMFENTIRRMPRPADIGRATTQELRDTFLVNNLFRSRAGCTAIFFTDLDPARGRRRHPDEQMPIELPNHKETGRAFFLELRRELGAINIGTALGKVVHVDGRTLFRDWLDCVYAADGNRSRSSFRECRCDKNDPAKFYVLSCLAHAAHPAAMMKSPADRLSPVALGAQATAQRNQRTI